MGQAKRHTPTKLGRKLKAIRQHLGLTGEQMIRQLDCPSIRLDTGSITRYEKGVREPAMIVVLKYARLVGMSMDILVDDELDLEL